jgi:hypothetical protein
MPSEYYSEVFGGEVSQTREFASLEEVPTDLWRPMTRKNFGVFRFCGRICGHSLRLLQQKVVASDQTGLGITV